MFEKLRAKGFQIEMLHHAEAILRHDMADVIDDIENILVGLEIPVEELIRGGGGEGQGTQRMRRALKTCGWMKHNFQIRKIVDGEEKESISHEVDHVKSFPAGKCALEIEWNTKDTFYDRDLENFKRLHADGVISLGVIITRGTSLQNALLGVVTTFAESKGINTVDQLDPYYEPTKRQRKAILLAAERLGSFSQGWARSFVSDKFGMATTHWSKLQDRIYRGLGNPCPLLLIGIPDTVLIAGI